MERAFNDAYLLLKRNAEMDADAFRPDHWATLEAQVALSSARLWSREH
jgi:hypothetical protein